MGRFLAGYVLCSSKARGRKNVISLLVLIFIFCQVELEIPVHEISLATMFGVIWH